jgi:hypothetical protein
LHFHDSRFCNSATFVAQLFNQKIRSWRARKVRAVVGSKTKAELAAFLDKFNSPEYRNRLRQAKLHPQTPDAARLERELRGYLAEVKGMPWSAESRKAFKSTINSFVVMFGLPICFQTNTPCTHNDSYALRVSRPFALHEDAEASRMHFTTATSSDRFGALTPYGTVIGFFNRADLVHTCAFSHDRSPDWSSALNKPVRRRRTIPQKGVFGYCRASVSVVESQKRASGLHDHSLLWLIPPVLLELALTSRPLEQAICRWVDSIVTTDAPFLAPNEPRDTALFMNDPEVQADCIECRGSALAAWTQRHTCTRACAKKIFGRWRCRYAMPQPEHPSESDRIGLLAQGILDPDRTRIGELHRNDHRSVPFLIFDIRLDRTSLFHRRLSRLLTTWNSDPTVSIDSKEHPALLRIQRSVENKLVSPYSKGLMNIVRGNMCTMFMGAASDANTAIWYIMNYMTKCHSSTSNMFDNVAEAIKRNDQFPSQAHDANEPSGQVSTLLQRILNKSGQQEFTTELMICALTGAPPEFASAGTAFFPARALVEYASALDATGQSAHLNDSSDRDPVTDDSGSDANVMTQSNSGMPISYSTALNARVTLEDDPAVPGLRLDPDGNLTFANPMHRYFANRDLLRFSLYEQCATLEVKTAVPPREHDPSQGRRPNLRLEYIPTKHDLVLRSQPCVPLLPLGLPVHPGARPWSRGNASLADRWAKHMMILFLPWKLDDDAVLPHYGRRTDYAVCLDEWCFSVAPGGIDSIDINQGILSDEEFTARHINLGRLALIRNIQAMTSSSKQNQEMLDAYRRQFANDLTDLVNRAAPPTEGSRACPTISPETADDIVSKSDTLMSVINGRITAGLLEQLVLDADCHTNAEADETTILPVLPFFSNDSATNLTRQQVTGVASPPENSVPTAGETIASPSELDVFSDIATADFTPSQFAFASRLASLATTVDTNGTLLVLHGGPGCGKTFALNRLASIFGRHGMQFCFAATTGVAAALLENPAGGYGSTLFRAIAMRPAKDQWLPKTRADETEVARVAIAACRVLIIDEMSMLSPYGLGRTQLRLRELTGVHHDWGGKIVVLSGDFNQLQPVAARSLLSPLGVDANSTERAGSAFFRAATVFLLQRVTGQGRFNARQGEIIDKILAAPNTAGSTIIANYSVLTHMDLMADDIGPIVTQCNYSRCRYNYILALRFAKRNNTALVRWLNADVGSLARHNLLDYTPEIYGYFVLNAPAMLLDNISPETGLANGVRVTMTSVAWENDETTMCQLYMINSASPGEIIDVPPPSFIILSTVATTNPRHFSVTKSMRCEDTDTTSSPLRGARVFPVDLMFALTFYKVQGITLDKLVIDMTKMTRKGFTFAEIYVALSRARSVEGVRLFHPIPSEWQKMVLKPTPGVLTWLAEICCSSTTSTAAVA